jgi:hypothetical protein
MNTFRINKYLSLKLLEGRTYIYVDGKRFRKCSYLILSIPADELEALETIRSIDEAANHVKLSTKGWVGGSRIRNEIPPETKFWGHCSNLQAWAEHGYNTDLLHFNLSFPLLKALTEAGDPKAKKVFKEEVARRFREGTVQVKTYLLEERIITKDIFTEEEIEVIFDGVDFEEFLKVHNVSGVTFSVFDSMRSLGVERAEKYLNDLCGKLKFWELDYSHRKLKKLPEYITKITSLSRLKITGNKLTELPDSFSDLKNLSYVNLGYNDFEVFPKELTELPNLTTLEITHTQLRELPEYITKMKKLESLWMNSGNLTEIPNYIGELTSLKKLDLSRHNLTEFPEGVCKLKNLRELNVAKNKLKTIPECIGDLTNLKDLIISFNNLKDLPDSIGTLPKLGELYIHHNPLDPQEYRKKFNIRTVK